MVNLSFEFVNLSEKKKRLTFRSWLGVAEDSSTRTRFLMIWFVAYKLVRAHSHSPFENDSSASEIGGIRTVSRRCFKTKRISG